MGDLGVAARIPQARRLWCWLEAKWQGEQAAQPFQERAALWHPRDPRPILVTRSAAGSRAANTTISRSALSSTKARTTLQTTSGSSMSALVTAPKHSRSSSIRGALTLGSTLGLLLRQQPHLFRPYQVCTYHNRTVVEGQPVVHLRAPLVKIGPPSTDPDPMLRDMLASTTSPLASRGSRSAAPCRPRHRHQRWLACPAWYGGPHRSFVRRWLQHRGWLDHAFEAMSQRGQIRGDLPHRDTQEGQSQHWQRRWRSLHIW